MRGCKCNSARTHENITTEHQTAMDDLKKLKELLDMGAITKEARRLVPKLSIEVGR
jgi:hypothetical protein